MNRRDFFKYGGALGALAALGRGSRLTHIAHADPQTLPPVRRLLIVFAQGGWDPTYAIDPKTQSDTVDVPAGKSTMFENLDVFTDTSRPNVTAFFTKYAAQTAIVRGIQVASVAHSECSKRMCTGTRLETSPDMGAVVAHDNGNGLPLPYLILGDTAFTGPYAVSAGRVGATNQILALLDPSQQYATGSGSPFVISDAEDTILTKYANASADRARAVRGATGYNASRVSDFVDAIDRGKRLQAVSAGFGHRGSTLALANQISLALDALQQDISQAVMVNTRLSWDTHTENSDQQGFHETTFGGLTTIMDQLSARPGQQAGTTMADDTVVVVYSEMGRTPKLNTNAGKDHWPVTSALVLGAGVKGGQVYGGTSSEVGGELVDYTTGAVSDAGQPVMTPNFVGGVLALCGVDPSAHLGNNVPFAPFIA